MFSFMSESDYYEKVSDFQNRLSALIRALSEAQKVISPSLKDGDTFPGLIDRTSKSKQLELLRNAWIVLKPIDDSGLLASDIEELIELLDEVGNCPIKCEPAFQGFKIGE